MDVAGFGAGADADGSAVLGPRLEPTDHRLPRRSVLLGESSGDRRSPGSLPSSGEEQAECDLPGGVVLVLERGQAQPARRRLLGVCPGLGEGRELGVDLLAELPGERFLSGLPIAPERGQVQPAGSAGRLRRGSVAGVWVVSRIQAVRSGSHRDA